MQKSKYNELQVIHFVIGVLMEPTRLQEMYYFYEVT
jgi:hypothetical protein